MRSTCVREKTTLDNAGYLLSANAERCLKSGAEMARLFAAAPRAVEETARFLDGLSFASTDLAYDYPSELREGFASEQEALEHFAREGAKTRYPDGVPDKVEALLRHELKLSPSSNYAAYFLTVHDIVRFARSQGHSRAGARLGRQFRRSAFASASPRSIRPSMISCSSASSPPRATSRPTSTSISSMSGARR